MTTVADVRRILDKHPLLHFDGYGQAETRAQCVALMEAGSVATITKVAAWLKRSIKRAHTVNHIHSVDGVRTLAERAIGSPVSSGQLIVAALICKYPMIVDRTGPHFAMSVASVRAAAAAHNPFGGLRANQQWR